MSRNTVLLLAALAAVNAASAATRTTATAGYWTNTATWVDGGTLGVPSGGDAVTVSHAVTLDTPTAALASCLNNATLTFMGTASVLRASEVTVNALITHPLQSDLTGANGVYADWAADNRVWIECSNLTVNAGKSIDANGKGYSGGTAAHREGYGPGGGKAGIIRGGGASHGGVGGKGAGTGISSTYGEIASPADPGSGGGAKNIGTGAGHGGGYVRIHADGHVLINGTITVNGLNGSGDSNGGGSGGGIYITCHTFGGTNGIISAGGGNGTSYGGGGGGGRIAVIYRAAAQQALGTKPEVALRASHGTAGTYAVAGGLGTVYLNDSLGLPEPLLNCNGSFSFEDSAPQWRIDSLTVSGGWVVLPESLDIVVTNDLRTIGAGRLDVSHAAVSVGGRLECNNGQFRYWFPTNQATLAVGAGLLIANNGACYLYAAATNATGFDYGGVLNLGNGNLTIVTNGTLCPVSNPTDGGSMLFKMRDLTVGPGAQVDANAAGFSGGVVGHAEGYGPGGGKSNVRGGGGGHGGAGGAGEDTTAGGVVNDLEAMPHLPGSGGGSKENGADYGGWGGGLIRMEALGRVSVHGAITANGGNPIVVSSNGDSAGAGAGGGIVIICRRFAGGGTLSAIGGNGTSRGGGGGGGRIAVWAVQTNEWSGTLTLNEVSGGTGKNSGDTGTVYWQILPTTGTTLIVR